MKNLLKRGTGLILILSILFTCSLSTAFADSEPSVKGKTAIVYCSTTDEIIWSKNADKKMNPASMTKLMTCLLAIENLDLDQEVEITQEATEVIPTKIYLKAGEKVTVNDLLHAAMLESANDAAMALGIATAGSVKDFAKMMNARAKKLGCKNTKFVNPSGLYAEGHVSTAYDIALISKEAFSNQILRSIASTLEYTIPATNVSGERELENGNMFLKGGELKLSTGTIKVKKYDEVFGGKTGTTEEGVATMTVGMNYDGLEIFTVIMGTTMEKRYSDIRKLLNYGKENVTPHRVFKKGAAFEETKILYGETNKIAGVAEKTGVINLPEGASASLVTTKAVYNEDLKAPIKKGEVIGKVEVYLSDEKICEVNLKAAESIGEGWYLSRFGITNFQTIAICVAAGVILLLILIIFALRIRNARRRKHRRQQRILEQARKELEREQSMKQRGWPY